MTLLEEAAAETLQPDHALRLEIRSERLEIARGLSVLAVIEAGCADVLPVTPDLDDRETP